MDINHYSPSYSGLEGRNFYSFKDFSPEEIYEILHTARLLKLKNSVGERQPYLSGKDLLMITNPEYSSEAISFRLAVKQLAGSLISMPLEEKHVQSLIESTDETAALACYGVSGIIVNTSNRHDAKVLARNTDLPVINAHGKTGPCEALAAMLTCWEKFGKLKDLTLCIIGNVREHSQIFQCAFKCGMNVRTVAPKEFAPTEEDRDAASIYSSLTCYESVEKGVKDCDAVYVSPNSGFGQDYILTADAFELAAPNAVFLHPMPIDRTTEAESFVCDGPQSATSEMAKNLIHAEKAVLALTMGKPITD